MVVDAHALQVRRVLLGSADHAGGGVEEGEFGGVEGLEVLAAWDTAEADGPAVTFQGPGATVVRAR